MAYADEGPWATMARECDCTECYEASQLPVELDDETPWFLLEELSMEWAD